MKVWRGTKQRIDQQGGSQYIPIEQQIAGLYVFIDYVTATGFCLPICPQDYKMIHEQSTVLERQERPRLIKNSLGMPVGLVG